MSTDKRWRLVCYDIRDDKRYRKVFKLLRGVARSVQYSIFRCRMDDREVERLRWQLAKLMAPEDALLVIDLCPSCASRVITRNHVDGWTEQPPTFRIIAGESRHHPPSAADDDETRASSGSNEPERAD